MISNKQAGYLFFKDTNYYKFSVNTKSKISSSDKKSFTVLYLKLFSAGSSCDVLAECVQVTSLPIVAKSNSNVKEKQRPRGPQLSCF